MFTCFRLQNYPSKYIFSEKTEDYKQEYFRNILFFKIMQKIDYYINIPHYELFSLADLSLDFNNKI